MEKLIPLTALVSLAACGVEGLHRDDIFGLARACGGATCATTQYCDPVRTTCVEGASLTGSVVSACDEEALTARLTIGGKATCTTAFGGKAYVELLGLAPGGPQTLAIGKTGYQAFSMQITLNVGYNVFDTVKLTPLSGCTGGNPADVECTCNEPNCE